MSDKIYLKGVNYKKAPTDFFMLKASICYEDIIEFMKENKGLFTESRNGKHYLNYDIKESKEVGKFGHTHYAEVNTWKPDQTTAPEKEPELPKQEPIDSDEIPF